MSRKVNRNKPASLRRKRSKRSGSFVPGAIFLEIVAALALYSLFNWSAEVRQVNGPGSAPMSVATPSFWNDQQTVGADYVSDHRQIPASGPRVRFPEYSPVYSGTHGNSL